MHARPFSRLPRVPLLALVAAAGLSLASCGGGHDEVDLSTVFSPQPPDPALVAQGQPIFRFETFGDETFFTDVLRLHEPVGTAVTPKTALAVGLKVDSTALPPAVVTGIQNGSISLDDPATTVALIKLNAVIGLKGTVNAANQLTRLGVTCAICHSQVDNSFAPGIGKRLDGWPN